MLTVYRSNGEALLLGPEKLTDSTAVPSGVVWIDLLRPTHEEDAFVEQLLGIDVPTKDELKDIEPSSRLYMENGTVYMTASIVYKADTDQPELTDVAFILTDRCLLTIRYVEPRSFDLFKAAMPRITGGCQSGTMLLARLLETVVDRTAEILEVSVARADTLSLEVFGDRRHLTKRQPRYLEDRLVAVSALHRLVAKTRDSLMSLSRLMTFLYAAPVLQPDRESRELVRTVSRDIQSLAEHASFISSNVSFLLDASLGLINLEQNQIIKIFSIASVALLPPTLIASIYGMNFDFMPELHATYAYPLSLAAMVASAVIPFFFFRWKGWL